MEDFLLDEDFDLIIANGDFVIGESMAQHQKTLILIDKGEFKEVPARGVASRRYLESETPDDLAREIRQEFTKDGMVVKTINIDANLVIQVDAYY